MNVLDNIVCPVCKGEHLLLKYKATYEYSYVIDSNAPGLNNTEELLPYMYDTREQTAGKQYVECRTCGASYPCFFDKWVDGINPKMLQEALRTHSPAKQKIKE